MATPVDTVPRMCTQVALVGTSQLVAGMHGAALIHFIFARKGSACIQLLAHGMIKDFSSRSEFETCARFSGCQYAEYEFPLDRTRYAWSLTSIMNGEYFMGGIPQFYHRRQSILRVLNLYSASDQNYDALNADVHLMLSDVEHIVSVALNISSSGTGLNSLINSSVF